jgi:hypothetical protein
MAKKRILEWSCAVVALLMITTGCSKEESEAAWYGEGPLMIGAEGGTVTGLNGDVTLTIPEGALSEPVMIQIQHMPRGGVQPGTAEASFTRPFIIEPYVEFMRPVRLTVKCSGCLYNGKKISEGTELILYVWKDQNEYRYQTGSCVSSCCSNASTQCMRSCISTTGVVTSIANNVKEFTVPGI